MGRFILFLIILIGSVWLGLKIAEDPGYALLTYRDWSIEMPLWFAAFSLVVAFFILYFLMRFLNYINTSFYRLRNWSYWRRKYKSYSKTNRGLIELIEGDWRIAENYLTDGIAQSDAPLINYLGLAVAAHELGEYEKRDRYLQTAHHLAPQADLAIGLTQAQLQLKQGKYEQALATLDRLRQIAPKQPVVLKLLERVYIHLADWPNLLKLLPSLRKAKFIPEVYLDKLEQKVYQELLANMAHKKSNDANAIRIVWDHVPKKFRKEPALVYAYVLAQFNHPDTAHELEELIQKTLKKTWDDHLAKIYGLLPSQNPAKQLVIVETWLKQYGNQPALLLTAARLCVHCQLWGKARTYYSECLRLENNRDAYIEYGKLLEQLEEMDVALENYRDGLVRI